MVSFSAWRSAGPAHAGKRPKRKHNPPTTDKLVCGLAALHRRIVDALRGLGGRRMTQMWRTIAVRLR
jgi:hypothetical protein